MIQDLFKSPIYYTDLKLDNKAMANYCLSYSKKEKGRVLSNEGGYQSDDLQGEHPVLNDLFLSIEEHCASYIKELEIKSTNEISNIWMNINGYKDTNLLHCHPNTLISGAYYVQTPKDCGNIHFHHPAYDSFQYDWTYDKIVKYNTYNSADWMMPSSAGRLYLFTSWLQHLVKPNLNKKEKRISISFNFYK